MKNTHIIQELQNGICELIFTDEHSIEHTISATLNDTNLPDGGTPDFIGTPTEYSIPLFNVAKEEWQTIQMDSIITIERLTGHGAPNNEKKLKASEEYLTGLLEEF
jgi:hypothetical protein|tara:strand:+ start:115 stop:432 length:318 start_codon:yes stop_codon:yes gene_type:complete